VNLVFCEYDVRSCPLTASTAQAVEKENMNYHITDSLASLAFYLQFPPGTSNVDAISKDNLVSIVKGSIADISNSINGNISSVQTLVAETSTTVTSTVAPSRPTEKDSNKMPYIIAGSVAGGLLVIIIAVIIIWKCSKPKNRCDKTGDLYNICYIYHEKSINE